MSHLRFVFAILSTLLAGCGSNVVDNPASDWEPTKTSVGVPAGAGVTKVIGSTGGQLTSADGLASPRSSSPSNALIDCNGKWIGTASVKQEGYATIEGVSITWTQDSASRGEARSYLPSGVVRFTPSDPCLQVNPSEAAITEANTRATLLVFFFADSLTYVGQGGTEWLADVTDTCEGGTPRRSLVGGAWFAGGGTSRGTTTISDRKIASGITSTYHFIRG